MGVGSYAKLSIKQREEAKERLRKWRSNLSEEKKEKIKEQNRVRARKNYKKSPEIHRQRVKESRKKHPHLEERRRAAKEYQKEHPEVHNRANKKWYKAHPEKKVEKRHKRRIREKNTDGKSFTSYEWKLLCHEYGNICLKCGQKKKLTPDHVIPLALGGSNSIDNIQPLCLDCNVHKGIKIVDYRKATPVHVEQLSFDSLGL